MCFLLLKKSTKNGIKNKILSGLAIAILGFFDIRFIYILGLLGLMLFLYQLLLIEKKNLIRISKEDECDPPMISRIML